MKIAVLGAGAWGLAIADVIAKKDFPVSVWEFDKNICNELDTTRKVENKLPGYVIPNKVIISNDIDKLVNESQAFFPYISIRSKQLPETLFPFVFRCKAFCFLSVSLKRNKTSNSLAIINSRSRIRCKHKQ